MAPKLDLKQSLRMASLSLWAIYIFACLSAIGIAVNSSRLHHERLAEVMALSVRNSLIIRDLRQVISTLNPSVGSSFTAIQFKTGSGESVVSLPSIKGVEASEIALFQRSVEIPIAASSQGSEEDQTFGAFRFSYSIVTPLAVSFGFWLFFLALVVPVLRQIRAYIIQRHGEILNAHKAELLAAIALQVSHDIRSPLSAIQIVVRSLPDIPSDKRDLLQDASSRISGIANDLLSTYRHEDLQVLNSKRSERSKMANELKPLVVSEFLQSIGKELAAVGENKKGMRVRLDLAHPREAVCMANEKELGRAISNLIHNAFEALNEMPDPLVTLALRSSGKKEIAIIISDNGKGIPEEIMPKLGKERVSSGKLGTSSGSGIGVLHAATTVELMAGKFQIQSKLGKGTIITIRLPRVDRIDPGEKTPL